MDKFYDIARAFNSVQKHVEESMNMNPYHMSRIITDQEGEQMSDVSLQKDTDDSVWQLVKGNGDNAEELVFSCTGVMCKANLPLIVRAPRWDKAFMLLQSITVTGLGCTSFDDVIAMLQEMKLTAERVFKHGTLDKWTPSMYQGFPMLTLSNQYFQIVKEGAQHEAVPFSDDVDPAGILQHLGKRDMVHSEDNVVQYFKAQTDDEGKCRFQQARPQLFRIRDVVEAQCSVITFKAKGIKH
ncbi:hypothetical protein EDD18DRAFT_1100960 [Armillaria luteobubalina]|uniref:Uncharacterized protein n=1 Tax=Armillaria luteobubalina TaxID=153913 RepID=A0AA39QGL5_9AGAR|nr:hypothetical protein EDD18DRAFT_1100960 [Armillaria luteobubalina]